MARPLVRIGARECEELAAMWEFEYEQTCAYNVGGTTSGEGTVSTEKRRVQTKDCFRELDAHTKEKSRAKLIEHHGFCGSRHSYS